MSSSDPKKRVLLASQRPENQRCADCNCKLLSSSVWASSTLGIFICINCSGRHRNLGTHITFVRSVTLDSWTNEQVELMEAIGNELSNIYWESRLPSDYPRPATEDLDGLTKFIRYKYELKKWADPDSQPPNLQIQQGKKPKKVKKVDKSMVQSQSSQPINNKHETHSVHRSNSETLIDFNTTPKQPIPSSSTDAIDLLLQIPPSNPIQPPHRPSSIPPSSFDPFNTPQQEKPKDHRAVLKSMLNEANPTAPKFGSTDMFRNPNTNLFKPQQGTYGQKNNNQQKSNTKDAFAGLSPF